MSLLQQGVAHGYIELLKRLYSQQAGTVRFDGKRSKKFEIQRGTKQGDPLSTLLFNSLLEHIFQQITTTWSRKKLASTSSAGADRSGDHSATANNLRPNLEPAHGAWRGSTLGRYEKYVGDYDSHRGGDMVELWQQRYGHQLQLWRCAAPLAPRTFDEQRLRGI